MTAPATLMAAARQNDSESIMDTIAACERQIVAAIAMGGIHRRSEHFEDAQNQSLMEIWRSASTYQGTSAPCSWMAGIARRITASRIVDPLIRHQKRTERLRVVGSRRVAPDPGEGAARTDLLQRVLIELSEEHREVLVLRYLLDLSLEQISERLELPAKTVSSRLTRAKRAALTFLQNETLQNDTDPREENDHV